MKKYILGVDIGGTACKLGLFDVSGNMLDKWEIQTDKSDCGKNVLKSVAKSLRMKMGEKTISDEELLGIGMGLPGTVDKEGFFDCPNLNWKHVAAQKEMQEIMGGIQVRALNDANAAALGEMWKGSARGYQDVVMVTIGTGVGGGIILGGNILEGSHGTAGEIGCMVVNPQETEYFYAGPKGCLEQYASATGLVNMTRKVLSQKHDASILDSVQLITAKEIFEAYGLKDKVATEVVDTFFKILGQAMAKISYIVDPEIYVIGGGVSKAGQSLLDGIHKAYLKEASELCRKTEFVLASLGNDAGMYGAVYAVCHERTEREDVTPIISFVEKFK